MKTIIGLTGGYCSGKSRAASMLETLGYANVDADALAHEALELCGERLANIFGAQILSPDGSIDRKILGRIVFASPEKLRLHESIVHPVILDLMEKQIAAREKVCINAPLLYRTDYVGRCHLVIEVRAPLCERIRRGRARDGLGVLDILRRIASQRPMWKLRPQGAPPVVFVDNRGSLEALKRKIEEAAAAAETIAKAQKALHSGS